jgi:aryl-alcohol dehydrogenase (NADP+)
LGRSDLHRWVRFVSVQPRYNLLFRQPERELLPLCLEEGLAVLPYNLLAGGLLTGKHDARSGPSQGTRFTLGTAAALYQERYWQDAELAGASAVTEIAANAGIDVVTLAAAWVLANPAVTAPIIGASRPEQLDTAIAAEAVTLDAGTRAALDDATVGFRRGDAAE